MAELYFTKEALRRLYRCHGYERAKRSLTGLLDHMAASELPEIKRLRRTLVARGDPKPLPLRAYQRHDRGLQ